MAAVNHSKILPLFDAILLALNGTLSAEEEREVLDFVEVDEYGVALETLADIIIEEQKSVSPDAFQAIQQLENEMGMGGILQANLLARAIVARNPQRPRS